MFSYNNHKPIHNTELYYLHFLQQQHKPHNSHAPPNSRPTRSAPRLPLNINIHISPPPPKQHPPPPPTHSTLRLTRTTTTPGRNRHLSSGPGPSAADARIEEITELYATAQDEFEIAMEETEKQTVYAQDDRDAAREELEKVLEAYRAAVEGEDRELAEEVRRRIGHRVRELEMGVKRMEEMATEHD
jgi:rRNA-processing protein FCF1